MAGAPTPRYGVYKTVANPAIPSNRGTFTVAGTHHGTANYVLNGKGRNAVIGYEDTFQDAGAWYHRYRECTPDNKPLSRRWMFEDPSEDELLLIKTYDDSDDPGDFPHIFAHARFSANSEGPPASLAIQDLP